MENYRKLSKRLQLFARNIVVGMSQTDAARIARPKSKAPNKLGYKLRWLPVVAAAIEELDAHGMENAGITSTRTWMEIARIAYFDHRKLADKDGNPVPLHLLNDDTVAAIAGIDVEELSIGRGKGRAKIGELKKYRAWNKVDALKMILLAKKELVERHELTGKDGAPLLPRSVDDLTDEQLADIARRGRAAPAEPPPGENQR